MRIEISLDRFMEIYRLMALGKLVQGLVHNVNGPLQNLGMDIEMMEGGVKSEERIPEDLRHSILNRLRRMEGEFDRIIRLIRSSTARIGAEEEFSQNTPLGGFLAEEISFLDANLYFKHNVRKEILLDKGLPPLGRFPQPVILSLAWLMQALVEETEKGNAKLFRLKAAPSPTAVEMSFTILEGSFPDFPNSIIPEMPFPEPFRMEDRIDLRMPLALLTANGGDVTFSADPTGLLLTLRIPCLP
jgi:hypothetical protein